MMNKHYLFYLVVIVSTISCKNNMGEVLNNNAKSMQKTSDFFVNTTPSLFEVAGTYDSMSQHSTNNKTCLAAGDNSDNIVIINPHSSLDFSQEQDFQTVQKALGVDFNEHIGYGPFSINIAYNYGKSSQDDSYTLNINYVYQYTGIATLKHNISMQGESILTPIARSALKNSPSIFRDLCGDGFIAQVDAGINVLMRINLKFNSSIEKNYFSDTLNKIGGLQNILSQISTNPNKINYSLTASGLQMGGNPDAFNQLFLKYDSHAIGQEGYPTITCSSDGGVSAKCVNIINEVIDYAKGIKKQINSPADYYYFNPIVSSWSEAGINPGNTDVNPSITHAMQQLTEQYYLDYNNYKFVNEYKQMLENKKLLSMQMQQNLNKIIQSYQNILKIYVDPTKHLMDCFNGFVSTSCLSIRDNLFKVRNENSIPKELNDLLEYLKSNQYLTNLYINNQDTTSCLVAPIETNKFLINCNGQTNGSFDSNATNLTFKDESLEVKNLIYYYDDNKYTYLFSEPLRLDSFFPNSYYGNSTIMNNSGIQHLQSPVTITRLFN